MAETNAAAPKVSMTNAGTTSVQPFVAVPTPSIDRSKNRREMAQAIAAGIVTRQAMRTPSSLAAEAVRYADAILAELEK